MKKIFVVLIVCVLAAQASGQYTFFEPKGSFAIEVSLENTSMKRLPVYRNSISSLAVIDDLIIGGTKAEEGLSPFLFVASVSGRELKDYIDLEATVPGQKSIVSGFCKGQQRILYAGTIPNGLDKEKKDGHLIGIQLNQQGIQKVTDLGTPVPGEGIFSLTINQKQGILYGITYPTGIFFSYDLKTKVVKTYKDLVPTNASLRKLKDEFGLKPEDYICKSLAIDNKGHVYGSAPINSLFYFDPVTTKLHLLKDSLPEVWGRHVLGQVESWATGPDGKLYGGNAGDGQLFVLDPATKKVKNLGKPIMMNRLRGLTFGKDGNLYGIAGAAPGYSHLFCYNADKGFVDYGNPQFPMKAPGIEQGIAWRGFQLGTIASSPDGKYIVMGEDEALSQLLVFPVN